MSKGTSTQVVATVQSALFGDSQGQHFNDIETVVGIPSSVTLDVDHPVKSITFLYGGVLDGIKLEYNKSKGGSTEKAHGTSASKGNGLTEVKVDIERNFRF
ncbi:hypothetical protein EST38_g10354 [Candolleomyces aberdarensis]|uniref:Jacalin-type lectin domain-containing protein n=1 Tax=Candolleomyces aberdarensis TaxID=2316362 RepID=A0A4Q2D7K8_9AGAR|nr:hypothetical protein EST38_g10354 [Candolleomyces aberdarensis]